MNKELIYDFTYESLVNILVLNGFKKYRADQVWHWLYNKFVSSFEEMKNIPVELKNFLNNNFLSSKR